MADLADRRITFLIPSLNLGGSERQALLLAKCLSRERGARVQVWGFGPAGLAAELCKEYGITWRSVPLGLPKTSRGVITSVLEFAIELRRSRTEITLPYCYEPNVVCGLAWQLAGMRGNIWNQRDEGRHFTGRRIERLAARMTRCFASNSAHGAEFLINHLDVPSKKIKVIYNGVELSAPESDRIIWRTRLHVDNDSFLVGMLANLTKFKDHATLLRAWRRVIEVLQEKGQVAILILAGALVNTQESLKALAFDLELGKTVRFLGVVKDIPGLLRALDLSVFSSRLEGVPNGILESMAVGLAVVGTDIPGIREALPVEGHGLLSLPGDDKGLAQHILEVYSDPEKRQRLGESNREWIQQNFNPERMCQEMTSLILATLK